MATKRTKAPRDGVPSSTTACGTGVPALMPATSDKAEAPPVVHRCRRGNSPCQRECINGLLADFDPEAAAAQSRETGKLPPVFCDACEDEIAEARRPRKPQARAT